jgi:hypothetical protein
LSDNQKALDTLLARIAALEARPAPAAAPQAPAFDARAFAQAFTADPVGVMTRLGIPTDHVSRVMVAHTLGDAAPYELRMLAAQGPQVSAVQAIQSDLQAVRQRQEAIEAASKKATERQSFSALAVDKTKYPLLAAAMAKNPARYAGRVDSHQGDAAALAATIEADLKADLEALGITPPASAANADTQQAQSTQGKQAQDGTTVNPGSVDPTPPQIQEKKPGVFTMEDHAALRDRIVRKHTPQTDAQ